MARYSDSEVHKLKQAVAKEPTPIKVLLTFHVVCDDCGRHMRAFTTDYQPDQPIKLRAKPCNHCRIKEEEVAQ